MGKQILNKDNLLAVCYSWRRLCLETPTVPWRSPFARSGEGLRPDASRVSTSSIVGRNKPWLLLPKLFRLVEWFGGLLKWLVCMAVTAIIVVAKAAAKT